MRLSNVYVSSKVYDGDISEMYVYLGMLKHL